MRKFIFIFIFSLSQLTSQSQDRKYHALTIATDPYLFRNSIPNFEIGWRISETIGVIVNGEYSSIDKSFSNFSQNAYSNQLYVAIQYKPYTFSFFNQIGSKSFEALKPWNESKKMLGKICISPMLELGYLHSRYDFKFVAREGLNQNLDLYAFAINNIGFCFTPSIDVLFLKCVFLDIGYQYKVLFPKIEGNQTALNNYDDYYSGKSPYPYRVEALPSFKIGVRIPLNSKK